MNDEPAAWFYYRLGETGKFMCGDAEAMKGIKKDGWVTTPLYLHPVKELTDEEIQLLINDVRDYDIDTHDLFEFARAILKKAQEK